MPSGAHFKNSNFQRLMRARVKRESLVASGKKGYAAAVAKHGLAKVTEKLVEWRKANASGIEQIVETWLKDLGVDKYEREHATADELFYLDFYFEVEGQLCAVECDGTGFHKRTEWLGEGDGRAERDERKARYCSEHHIALLRLSEQDIRSGAALEQLREFVTAPVVPF